MVASIVGELREKILKNLMEILVLTEVKRHPSSGYDLLAVIHKKFDILVSPGTVYSMLYSLEREGWLKSTASDRKRVYELTGKAEQGMETVKDTISEMQEYLRLA